MDRHSFHARAAACAMLCFILAVTSVRAGQEASSLPARTTPEVASEFVNGLWFDGTEFVRRTVYSVHGVLQEDKPLGHCEVFDLAKGYVVPAYGDAHTHRPANLDRFPDSRAMFLHDGIYYLMNQGSPSRYTSGFRALQSQSPGIEVAYASAMLASAQSHAVELWTRLLGRGAFPDIDPSSLDGEVFHIVDSAARLQQVWPQVLVARPDFIKVMIEYSEEFDRRDNDPAFFGHSGLNPELIDDVVRLAHGNELRVSAHIETAADFHVAVAAGVDIVAHLPGYDIPASDANSRYEIASADAELAAERGITVITTTLLGFDRAGDDVGKASRIRAIQRRNLRLLSAAGVNLAIGSDLYSRTALAEAMNLHSLGVFDNRSLLRMLSVDTPRLIFPGRGIGSLEPGAEASFLVLDASPLDDFQNVARIHARYRNGVPLH